MVKNTGTKLLDWKAVKSNRNILWLGTKLSSLTRYMLWWKHRVCYSWIWPKYTPLPRKVWFSLSPSLTNFTCTCLNMLTCFEHTSRLFWLLLCCCLKYWSQIRKMILSLLFPVTFPKTKIYRNSRNKYRANNIFLKKRNSLHPKLNSYHGISPPAKL